MNQQLADVENFDREAPDLMRPALAALRALVPPEADEEQVDEMISAGEEGLAEVEEGNADENTFDRFTQLARDYGLKGCTENTPGGSGGGGGDSG